VYSGQPLPNTEEPHDPVTSPNGKYRPMAFGPVGRAWEPRPRFAGTYDQNWLDNVFPFLPADFDERYYQAAPADQQIGYLRGGEQVTLYNLMPQERMDFRLPTVSVPVTFELRSGKEYEEVTVNDTIIIEPDLGRFMMIWRAARPLNRDIFEIRQVITGRMPAGWYYARSVGKPYYPSLHEVVLERGLQRQLTEEAPDRGQNL
jgi:hypothetical protein